MTDTDSQAILARIPHRFPFLLVDKIVEINCTDKKQSIVAIKNVSFCEPHLAGHFPGLPVMPGVLMIEALAQASGLLIYNCLEAEQASTDIQVLLAGADHCRFRKIVIPGDQVYLHSTVERRSRSLWRCKTHAQVDGQPACAALLTLVETAKPHGEVSHANH